MPIKLFSLRNVPEDEAAEIRALLNRHGIDYYETPPGNWGVSAPAFWLKEAHQVAECKKLIDQYQHERAIRAREAYWQMKKEGRQRTMLDLVRENPVRVIVYLAAIALVLYFSTKPFVNIGN